MQPNKRLFWLCATLTLLSALTSAGFSLAALSAAGLAHHNAQYGVSRSLALAVGAGAVAAFRSTAGLLTMASLLVLVQSGDAIIGAINHDPTKTLGPALLAAVTLASLLAFFRSALRRPVTPG